MNVLDFSRESDRASGRLVAKERGAWAATTLILASVAAGLGMGMFARTAAPNPFAHRLLLALPDRVSLDSTAAFLTKP